MNVAQLADWMPIQIYWEGDCPMLEWCYFGEARFVEPFFEDTISKRLHQPFNLLFRHQTPMATLSELQAVAPGLPPTGFIFHMSRCGSTLTAQMLAALPQNIVIAEAGPIDTLLSAHWRNPTLTDEQRIEWLRALVSAFARPRHGEEHCFIKFDSWHTLALPLILRAFPGVPWLFLYREPLQVLVSHQRQRGRQMVPLLLPPQWFGLEPTTLAHFSLDDYCAFVLAQICEAALRYGDQKTLWVNYRQLPAALWGEVATHFQMRSAAAEIEYMRQTSAFDAKNPTLAFVEDTRNKAQMATPALRQAADQWLWPLYTALEERRCTTLIEV